MSDAPDDKPPVQPPIVQPVMPTYAPSAMDKLVPTSNGDALLSYYLGLFSIVPYGGLVMGIIAFVKGRVALRRIAEEPQLPGKTHAYVGIGCGVFGLLFNVFVVVGTIALIISLQSRGAK